MDQSFAVWLLIALALVTSNLPFVAERPFLALPWRQKGEAGRPGWFMWLSSILFFVVLTGLGAAAMILIGQGVFMASDAASVARFLAILLALAAAASLVLAYPGWRSRGRRIHKNFFERLLELLVFYALVGVLGFALEANLGNRFQQGWEFYAITLSLFVVLGYPGFVWRYLMKRRRSVAEKGRAKLARAAAEQPGA
ncbi:DUF2818 family protein [Alcaligenaceae bacterium]|nr:DUF2818 family protein [Alcaligenaceae bacterium]